MAVYNIDIEYNLLIPTACTAQKVRLTLTPTHIFDYVLISDPILSLDLFFFASS